MRKQILSIGAVLAVAASSFMSVAPVAAFQPVPIEHTVGTVYPQSSAAAGVRYADIGDVQKTNAITVRATGMSHDTTLTFQGGNGAQRKVLLKNGAYTVIDFGSPQNVDGVTDMLVLFYSGISTPEVHLDVWALS